MLPAPLAEYLEAMARGASCLPPPLLASLHGALRHLEARGALLAAARFIHFGSVPEYPAALAEVIAARLRPFYAQGGGAPPEGPLHALLWRGEGGEGGEGDLLEWECAEAAAFSGGPAGYLPSPPTVPAGGAPLPLVALLAAAGGLLVAAVWMCRRSRRRRESKG